MRRVLGLGAAAARVTMSLPSSTLLEACVGSIVLMRSRACGFDVSFVDRHLHEVRIAEEARAIEIRAAHRLGHRGECASTDPRGFFWICSASSMLSISTSAMPPELGGGIEMMS